MLLARQNAWHIMGGFGNGERACGGRQRDFARRGRRNTDNFGNPSPRTQGNQQGQTSTDPPRPDADDAPGLGAQPTTRSRAMSPAQSVSPGPRRSPGPPASSGAQSLRVHSGRATRLYAILGSQMEMGHGIGHVGSAQQGETGFNRFTGREPNP